jgi:hypothetical protein
LSVKIPQDWFVNPNVLGEFYEKYRDHQPEEIRKVSFEQGVAVGRSVVQQLEIEGNDTEAVVAVLRSVLKDEPTAKIRSVEEGKILLRNSGFCPLMTACLSMNLPWKWLCSVLGWPFFHGLASAVNPKVDLVMTHRREKGDPYCDHIFKIGEGRLTIP